MSDEPKYTLPATAPFWYESEYTDNGSLPPQTRYDLIHRVATFVSKVNSQHAYWKNQRMLERYNDVFLLRLWDFMNLEGYGNAKRIISFSIYEGHGEPRLLELVMDNRDQEDLILAIMNKYQTYDPQVIEKTLNTSTLPLFDGTL